MKKIIGTLLIMISACSMLTSCNNNSKTNTQKNNEKETAIQSNDQIVNVYRLAQSNGYTGTYEEWLKSIKGSNGVGIKSITLSKTEGLIDTYTILFTDGSTSTYTITNANSIVKIEKTGTKDNVDTYTISYSNGTSSTFTITNGLDGSAAAQGIQGIQGEKGEDGHTPVITIGSNGNWYIDGVDSKQASALKGDTGNGISEIKLTSQKDNIDTYTITYTNGNKTTFNVTNGKDGNGSTSIGDNGTLIINGFDTGIIIDYSKVDDRVLTTEQKFSSSGLNYYLRTINGITGYVVSEYDTLLDTTDYYRYADVISYDDYIEYGDAIESKQKGLDIVIPNYIGTVPVIGIEESAFSGNSFIWNVSLSKNTIYLGDSAFKGCTNLKSIDFNGSSVKTIGNKCFENDTNFSVSDFPDTITYVGDYAFYGCKISQFNFNTVKHIGSYAFYGFRSSIYLPKTIDYVGSYAFGSGYLFLEHDEIPSTWGSNINGTNDLFGTPVLSCVNNGEYIYSISNNEITLHHYLGNETKLTIPETIDGKNVKNIGYGFNSYIYDDWDDIAGGKVEYDTKGYIKELYIPSFIEKIEYSSLLVPDTFIYISKGVKEVWGYIGFDVEIDVRIGCIVFEDSSNITFKIGDKSYGYNSYIELDDELSFRVFSGYSYSNIYYDYNTKTYYYNEGTYYSAFACFDFFGDEIIIPDTVNNLPIQQVGKYAYGVTNASKITIGNNVRKIKSYAFGYYGGRQNSYVYIPSSVEIINSYGFILENSTKYYIEESKKPEDWDTNWNNNNSNIEYSYTLEKFNNIGIYDDFLYTIVGNEVYLLKYNGSGTTIKIPRTIKGKNVTTISSDFFSYYSSCYIYIPSTITKIESKAFINKSYSTFYFYFESSEKDENISEQYYYNTQYGNYYNYKSEKLSKTFDY